VELSCRRQNGGMLLRCGVNHVTFAAQNVHRSEISQRDTSSQPLRTPALKTVSAHSVRSPSKIYAQAHIKLLSPSAEAAGLRQSLPSPAEARD
jgi:hypothetical protein